MTSGGPTVNSFSPMSGMVGSSVTIIGSNFSATGEVNIVKFNGITSVVANVTGASITVVVPASATTGKISITVDGKTATSANDFTVSH
ncbi:MAG TPA: IPT/TIG domain-containing protein [Cyclobacteriaceae bacterium]|nr:IPT/TIG domain-containing protein [Cyclobacteriaceae bacterium]